jgi:rhodanese-related sulfurtransferase
MLRTRWSLFLDVSVCVLVIATAVRFAFMWQQSRAARVQVPPVAVGTRLAIDNVEWASTKRHVVVLLSEQCVVCRRSIATYRGLVDAAHRSGVATTVLLPAEEANAEQWLTSAGVIPGRVIRLSAPRRLGLTVTPTVFLVDQSGTVTDLFLGAINADAQRQLLRRFTDDAAVQVDNSYRGPSLDLTEFKALKPGTFVLLNVRPRPAVAAKNPSPDRGELNMPLDELRTRAPLSLPRDKRVVVDCRGDRLWLCLDGAQILESIGFANVAILKP